jgi:hypothetical protein
MGRSDVGQGADWVPEACTLPAAQLPERRAEFSRLFADCVLTIDRPQPDWLRLHLKPTADAARRAAELAVAESACCSFFSFALRVTGGTVALEVIVPENQVAALDGLADLASAAQQRR